jgi:hypothetical protein
MMHKFLIISFAFIASNQNEVSSFAQLQMQRQPGQFMATAQATLDSFIDNAQNCDLHQIAKTIFNSWGSLDKQSK